MTAFTGVMFVLFCVIVVIDLFGISRYCDCVGVDLPRVSHPSPMPGLDREDALIVAIMRDGKVFFGNDQVMRAELAALVAQRLKSGGERRIYVKADARVRYRSVKASLDEIWAAGVQDVGLLTERRR